MRTGRPLNEARKADPLTQIPVPVSVRDRLRVVKDGMNRGKRKKVSFGDVIMMLLDKVYADTYN